jgi:hypothetical protein
VSMSQPGNHKLQAKGKGGGASRPTKTSRQQKKTKAISMDVANTVAQNKGNEDALRERVQEAQEERDQALRALDDQDEPANLLKRRIAERKCEADLIDADQNLADVDRATTDPVVVPTLPLSDGNFATIKNPGYAGVRQTSVTIGDLHHNPQISGIPTFKLHRWLLWWGLILGVLVLLSYQYPVTVLRCVQICNPITKMIVNEDLRKAFVAWLKTDIGRLFIPEYKEILATGAHWRLPYFVNITIRVECDVVCSNVTWNLFNTMGHKLPTQYLRDLFQICWEFKPYSTFNVSYALFKVFCLSICVCFNLYYIHLFFYGCRLLYFVMVRGFSKVRNNSYRYSVHAWIYDYKQIRRTRLVAVPIWRTIKTRQATHRGDARAHMDRTERLANTNLDTYQICVEVEYKNGFRYFSDWEGIPCQWFERKKCLKTVQLNEGLISTCLNRRTLVAAIGAPELAVEASLRLMQANPHYQEDYTRLLRDGRSTYRDMALVMGAIVSRDVYHVNLHF